MKKIIILGSSPAGVKAAEEIRTLDKESEITIFCEGHQLPYQRELFGEFVAKTITEDKVFYQPQQFYHHVPSSFFLQN